MSQIKEYLFGQCIILLKILMTLKMIHWVVLNGQLFRLIFMELYYLYNILSIIY